VSFFSGSILTAGLTGAEAAVSATPVGAAVTTVGSLVGISFKQPSEKRAAAVLPGVVQSANSGNLLAVGILDTRRSIGISAERAVWAGGFGQVSASVLEVYNRPDVRAKVVGMIPASAQSSPEAAANYATSNRFTVDDVRKVDESGGIAGALSSPKATKWLGFAALGLLGVVMFLGLTKPGRKLVASV
jgi:hypothetical protein